ncbi:ABC transporter permease [Azorhizobium oxalatiphilum]|uniref:ABC transporter permease n=1 Tax=Azorhizobium oxalatiphilum TaxID=980631 RepID=A0A917FB72_9HYPH|nr:ABC transporter permease [Azorhizobium oxalatiphilum]GGF61298.1 ABC transporter permease [Azorhizobium oxalatiphilum]
MSATADVPARTTPARRRSGSWDGLILLVLALLAWQGMHLYVGEAALASPVKTLTFLAGFLRGPVFWGHFAATLAAFGWALLIGAVGGIVIGLVLGERRFAGDVAEPILAGLYAIPKVTLYPMILLIFGLGMSAKVAFGVIHGIIPIILFTMGAVKTISPVLLRAARAMRLTRRQTALEVLVPAVLPEILTGLRIGFSLTFLGVLIGEMFASQRGLGFLIVNGINLHNVPMTTGMILVIVLFALAANGLLLWLHRRFGGPSATPEHA